MIIFDGLQLIGLVITALACVPIAVLAVLRSVKQARCRHEQHSFSETSACDAICRGCGKNLGFIGAERERRSAIRGGRE